jgi:hypothetical protein
VLRKSGFHPKIKGIVLRKSAQRMLVAAVGPKRAAAIVAGFADDALLLSPYAPVAVATDIANVGMLIWCGWDIYQIVKLVQNAEKLDQEMEARKNKAIRPESIKIANDDAAQHIREKLHKIDANAGLKELAQDENALFDFLAKEPLAIIEFQREGIEGKEKWTFENGKTQKVEIYKEGNLYASMEDKDASLLEEGFHEIERVNPEENLTDQIPAAAFQRAG